MTQIDQMSAIFAKTLSSIKEDRKQAENVLSSMNINDKILDFFFSYISTTTIDINLRMVACTFLENYIKDYWFNDTEKSIANPGKMLSEETKKDFKSKIITLLLNSESSLTPILSNMISHIVVYSGGYLKIWKELMEVLAKVLKEKNYKNSSEIYFLISKIIKRYHIESKSAPLFEEIINTMKYICDILTEDAKKFSDYLLSLKGQMDNNTLPCIKILLKILDIFYSLNYQDFPEYFEDHLDEWISILINIIDFSCGANTNSTVFDACLRLKAKCMKCVNHYFINYFDDIRNVYTKFFGVVWKLNDLIKNADSFSKLTKELILFYQTNFAYKRFENKLQENDVSSLIQNLIMPNMRFTEKENEEYEEDPINFIKIELEEADMDSNKYYAINLLRNILENYPKLLNDYLNPYLNELIKNYYDNPIAKWNDKICAINLIFAVQIKTYAQRLGVTTMNGSSNIDIIQMIGEIFTKEFNLSNSNPLCQIYSLKFLMTFRRQIPNQYLENVIQALIDIINKNGFKRFEVSNASLLTLERILIMKDLNCKERTAKEAVNKKEIFQNLVSSLVNFINNDVNIFAMRCLFNTLLLADTSYYEGILENLTLTMKNIIKKLKEKSEKDEFNYYYFETCCIILKKSNEINKNLVNYFEKNMRVELSEVLTKGITDLMGYTLQFFSYYLSISDSNFANDDFYRNLVQNIIVDLNSWNINNKYMFNPFISFLKITFITNKASFKDNKDVMRNIFKICEQVLNLKCVSQVFEILDALISYLDFTEILCSSIEGLLNQIILMINQNAETNPKLHDNLGKELIIFISKLIISINLQNTIENFINKIGGINLLLDLLSYSSFITDSKTKKLVIYSYCNFISSYYNNINEQQMLSVIGSLFEITTNFYKINIWKKYNNKDEDRSYASNNYNKLVSGSITFPNSNYDKIGAYDEEDMIFEALKKIFSNTGKNYVIPFLTKLKLKQVLMIQNICEKHNYPYK